MPRASLVSHLVPCAAVLAALSATGVFVGPASAMAQTQTVPSLPRPLDNHDTAVVAGETFADGDELVEKTMVVFGGGGKPEIRTEWITRREQEAMKRARARSAARRSAADSTPNSIDPITGDPACGGNSLWLFDAAGLQGRMLCLARTSSSQVAGSALKDFFRTASGKIPLSWAFAVRSFWAGTDGGYFRTVTLPYPLEAFDMWQRVDTVSNTVANAGVVVLVSEEFTVDIRFLTTLTLDPGSNQCTIPRTGVLKGLAAQHLASQIAPCGAANFGFGGFCNFVCTFRARWGETYSPSGSQCFLTADDLGNFLSTRADAPAFGSRVLALDVMVSPTGQCIPGFSTR